MHKELSTNTKYFDSDLLELSTELIRIFIYPTFMYYLPNIKEERITKVSECEFCTDIR